MPLGHLTPMPASVMRYVLRQTWRHQIVLALLSIAIFALSTAPLELQRRIINDAIAKGVNSRPTVTPFSRPIMTPLGGQEWAYPGSAQEGPAPVAQRPWRCAQRRAWEVPVYPRG